MSRACGVRCIIYVMVFEARKTIKPKTPIFFRDFASLLGYVVKTDICTFNSTELFS